jgi:hypothetical protein
MTTLKQQIFEIIKKMCSIPEGFTGKINIEINVNEGRTSKIIFKPEITLK